MSLQQKIVKYVAISLAVLLILAIIGGFITGIFFLTGVLPSLGKKQSGVTLHTEDFTSRSYRFQNIESIEVESSVYSVHFSRGSEPDILVELTNVYKDYRVEQDGNTLKLEESDKMKDFQLSKLLDFLDGRSTQKEASIRITVPEDYQAKEIELEGGVGSIELEDLACDYLEIDAGVGSIKGSRITASTVDIDGGTGNIKFTSSAFGNTDIDSGVGNVTFHGVLHGHTSIDCGVGNTELSLSDSREQYFLSLEKGLGSIRLDGTKVESDTVYIENPDAAYSLELTGGVGNIVISFTD